MSYATYEDYNALYPGTVVETDYERLAWEADRMMDRYTTGADNVRKLRVAFPTDEYAVETVQRCEFALVNLMYRIEQAEADAAAASRYITDADGSVHGAVVSSVSSGSESKSFATGSNAASATAINEAVGSISARNRLFGEVVRNYLSGTEDANGVNLLFMGVYPRV